MSFLRFFVALWIIFQFYASALASDRILVMAPSSMTDVMAELGTAFRKESGIEVVVSLAGSAQLARQLEAGAEADLFVTADAEWMDWVKQRGLVDGKSVRVMAGNRLVLAVRNEVENWADMEALITKERFAMADADSVPAGRYTKQALQNLKLWDRAQHQAVFGENVRVTLRRLALGEVSSAFVYATDVAIEPKVRAFFTFPEDSHEPIQYWVAFPPRGKEQGLDFLGFLRGRTATEILKKFGFLKPKVGN